MMIKLNVCSSSQTKLNIETFKKKNYFDKCIENETRQTLMLSLDKMVPSATVGGTSKEEGPSRLVIGDAGIGLVGVVVEDGVTGGETGVEPAEDGGNEGWMSRKPGLLGDDIRAVGERAKLACTVRQDREDRSDVTMMS